MKRVPLRRRTPLRRSARPARRAPLRRTTPLRPGPWREPTGDGQAGQRRPPVGASEAQRRKTVGAACIVLRADQGHHAGPRRAALARRLRSPGLRRATGWLHHRAYDTGKLELLPYLEPRWRAEIAHAVLHLGLIGAVRRLAPESR